MKKTLLTVLIAVFAITFSYAATEIRNGSINIFSKTPNTKIYVDGIFQGSDSVQMKEVQPGTHFIKVNTFDGTTESNIFAEIIEVVPGETTTIYVTEKGIKETKYAPLKAPVDVYKTKKILDYSKEMHTGWYIKFMYLTNLYYNLTAPNLDLNASTMGPGLGFKIPLAQNLDFTLELERATLSSSHATWYFMPISANLQISFLPSPYFRGKQYYGLGLEYIMTDLETDLKQNLTALGYKFFYGLEMPASDQNAFFFEVGYHIADISRYNYSLNAAYVSAGYRWDVEQ